jgi:hypothetical protein
MRDRNNLRHTVLSKEFGEPKPTKSSRNYTKSRKVCQHKKNGYTKTGTRRELFMKAEHVWIMATKIINKRRIKAPEEP